MIRIPSKHRRLIRQARFAVLLSPVWLVTGCFSTPTGDASTARAIASDICTPEDAAELLSRQVLELVNLERAAANMGLQPVTLDLTLTEIADDYACRMIEIGFFDHVDPVTGHGPGDRAIAGKYRYYAVGENLAAGPIAAAEVLDLWMESDTHREIILDPQWTEMGLAVKLGGEYGTCWVQMFGTPADDY
ncbi:MAG: CAP domain-containing protein [Phycisphaerae bacterium]